jgi:tetratricopeptide (TPR) repeat protein
MKTLSKAVAGVLGCGMILVIFAFILKKPNHQVPQDPSDSSSHPFPELLLRNDALRQTAEWQANVHRVSALSSQLIQNPHKASALIELAQIYTVEARVTGEHGYYYPAILTMLDRVLSQDQLSDEELFEATTLKANVLLSQHRFNDGLLVAEEAYKMNPYSAQVFAALIDANVELGNYEKAVELTDQLMEIKPGLLAYARASYLRELHGDLDGAIEAMQMAVDAGYPGFENTEWSRITLAELFEKKGDLEKAEATYRTSLAVRENNPFAMGGLARIMTSKGEFEQAEMLLKTALEAVPEISFQEDLYRLYKAWGKEQEARDAYAEVIEMIEDDAKHGHKVDLDYAKILFELGGNVQLALEKVLNEHQIRPDNLEVNALLAKIYHKKGDLTLSKMHLEKALRTGYSNAELETIRNERI